MNVVSFTSACRGRFLKNWSQVAKHRESSIHLCSTPTPNFYICKKLVKNWVKDAKVGRRSQNGL